MDGGTMALAFVGTVTAGLIALVAVNTRSMRRYEVQWGPEPVANAATRRRARRVRDQMAAETGGIGYKIFDRLTDRYVT